MYILGIETSTTTGSVSQVALTLNGTDPDGPATNAWITSLPWAGRLYQTTDGLTRGDAITNTPALVENPALLVLYVPPGGVSISETFAFSISDGYLTSGPGIKVITMWPTYWPTPTRMACRMCMRPLTAWTRK